MRSSCILRSSNNPFCDSNTSRSSFVRAYRSKIALLSFADTSVPCNFCNSSSACTSTVSFCFAFSVSSPMIACSNVSISSIFHTALLSCSFSCKSQIRCTTDRGCSSESSAKSSVKIPDIPSEISAGSTFTSRNDWEMLCSFSLRAAKLTSIRFFSFSSSFL